MGKRSWAWVVGTALAIMGGLALLGWHLFLAPIFAVETLVRSKLQDPASAKFSGVMFNKRQNAGCGFVDGGHFILFPSGELRFMPRSSSGVEDTADTAAAIGAYRLMIERFCNPM